MCHILDRINHPWWWRRGRRGSRGQGGCHWRRGCCRGRRGRWRHDVHLCVSDGLEMIHFNSIMSHIVNKVPAICQPRSEFSVSIYQSFNFEKRIKYLLNWLHACALFHCTQMWSKLSSYISATTYLLWFASLPPHQRLTTILSERWEFMHSECKVCYNLLYS